MYPFGFTYTGPDRFVVASLQRACDDEACRHKLAGLKELKGLVSIA
jgi:hypothetical protein